jgi:hypothetical protein
LYRYIMENFGAKYGISVPKLDIPVAAKSNAAE